MTRFSTKAVFSYDLFVGIDIAKYDHVASAYDSATGELVIDSLVFNNNDECFQSLLSVLPDSDDMVFGFESTAHYHLNLFNFLSLKSYTCFLLNLIQTHGFRNLSIRDAKNDCIDFRSIAQFLMFSHDNPAHSVPPGHECSNGETSYYATH